MTTSLIAGAGAFSGMDWGSIMRALVGETAPSVNLSNIWLEIIVSEVPEIRQGSREASFPIRNITPDHPSGLPQRFRHLAVIDR